MDRYSLLSRRRPREERRNGIKMYRKAECSINREKVDGEEK